MEQNKTYQDLKNSLKKDYEFFHKIMGYENIYNSEYKSLNKVFKGLTKKTTYIKDFKYNKETEKYENFKREYPPYYTAITGGNFYGDYLTKDDLANLDKDFPNIKKDYELLKARKPKVKLGKRPVNETEEHKQKMLQRALESDLGKCGYCERYIEIENNVIYEHGFRKLGYRAGVCAGANMLPYERSPEAKELLVKHLLNQLDIIVKQAPTQATVNYYNSDVFKYTDQKSCDDYNNAFARYSNQVKIGDWISNSDERNYLDVKFYSEVTLDKLNTIWIMKKDAIQIALDVEQKKLKSWKPTPTLREQAHQQKRSA